MSSIITIQQCIWDLRKWNKARKIKSIMFKKEEVKWLLFIDDIIVYVEDKKIT